MNSRDIFGWPSHDRQAEAEAQELFPVLVLRKETGELRGSPLSGLRLEQLPLSRRVLFGAESQASLRLPPRGEAGEG